MSKYTKGKATKEQWGDPQSDPRWVIFIGGQPRFQTVGDDDEQNAGTFVRRWNAFEEGGSIETTKLDIAEASVKFERGQKIKGQEWLKKAFRTLESALAQAKSIKAAR